MRPARSFGLHGPWRVPKEWPIDRLNKQVNGAVSRARRILLPATLTLEEWIVTIDHFAGRCAYCRKRPFQVLEHFVSITNGGGTTPGNYLPACLKCNAKKIYVDVDTAFPNTIEELDAYLEMRSTGKNEGHPPQKVINFRAELARETRWMSGIDAAYFQQKPIDSVLERRDYYSMLTEEEKEAERATSREKWAEEWGYKQIYTAHARRSSVYIHSQSMPNYRITNRFPLQYITEDI